MTDRFSEEEAVAAVALLTRPRLKSFVEAEIVIPMSTDHGPMYQRIDIVRMELLCELSEQFDLDEDALGVVISLIDQLHGVRAELHAVLGAIELQPDDVRERIAKTVQAARGDQ